ncbi:MAG TPA: RluA family pseudouridine synthase [Candidatus Uhrbacteria bacterium]|nr:RluA family pseudouridine synthase [Candidatus Uhrbacteria bacterium]
MTDSARASTYLKIKLMLIKIKPKESNQRLDKFLTAKLPISRSQIQKLIKAGQILVNGKKSNVHNFLNAGDVIKVNAAKKIKELTTGKKLEPNKKVKFKIAYEDNDILVINKPAGLMVHPTEKMENNTLVNGLLDKYPEIKKIGDDSLRPGIVHRLDKAVSGLILVCKTQKAFDYYKKQFQDRKIKKIYTALVHGWMEKTEGEINLPIERAKGKGKMAVKPISQGGKEAITKYNVIKQFKNFSLLEINILTGRTHQIRVHLNAIQHPIVGDKLYKQKKVKEKLELDRPFLHSTTLGFENMDSQYQEFTSKLPAKLLKVLKTLS